MLDSLISIFDDDINPSSILSSKEYFTLSSIIASKNISYKNGLELIYRGSDHGFTASSFHNHCDGKSNTLTLILSEHGNVFGGYTKIPWSSNTGWHTDSDSFVFILRSKNNDQPIVYDIDNKWLFTAVYHEQDWCSVFGYCGYAICIHDNCNKNDDSFSVHSETFKTPKTLAGKPQFQVIEYEMFQIR